MRRRFAPFIAAVLVMGTAAVCFAQGTAPPPPPPAEGFNPSDAPVSSQAPLPTTATVSPKATSAAGAPPPPPPSEGLNPASAPASSQDALPVTATNTNTAPSAATADDENAIDNVAMDTSVGAVFKLDFMRRALWVGLVVSAVCAFLGVYVVLKRIVFVGVALSQMSSAGVALSLLITGMSPMVGSVLTMLIGVGLLSVRWGGRRIRQDAFIGIGYAVAAATAILLVARSPKGEGDLLQVLFGNILTVAPGEANVTAFALAGVLAFHLLFYKELLFVSFDPDTAAASGYAARWWELLLSVTIGLTIAFAIHAVGVLLPFAALVIPAVGALLLTRRMVSALLISMLLGIVPVPVGLYLSFVSGLPSGETVVAVSFLLLLLVGAYAKIRGTAS